MGYRLDVICTRCETVAASAPVGMESDGWQFDMSGECRTCIALGLHGRAPQVRGASRYAIWRETRRFRRQLGLQASHRLRPA